MKVRHLVPALAAMLLIAAALGGGVLYAQAVEREYVHALAPRHVPLNVTGSALQIAALQQPDLLPVYGASEVLNQPSAYQSSQFFATYPTGFTTFEVAKGGVTSIIVAEELAAVAPDLRGKKIVISYTPSQFTSKMVGEANYAGLFSRLHANELAFSTVLSLTTKQQAARRMLQYPQTLNQDPVLQFALEQLADGSPLHQLLYDAVFPLGKLQTLVLELQDQWQTLTYIESQKNLNPSVTRQPAWIDWQALAFKARQEQIPNSIDNPFGFDNTVWSNRIRAGFRIKANGSADKGYLSAMENSAEWTDLDIVLRILKDAGAQPLLLGRPMNADYYSAVGISESAQQQFYIKLHQVAQRYDVPVVDFQDHAQDKYFGVDPAPHTSREGWVYVDQAMDAFYHGILKPPVD